MVREVVIFFRGDEVGRVSLDAEGKAVWSGDVEWLQPIRDQYEPQAQGAALLDLLLARLRGYWHAGEVKPAP